METLKLKLAASRRAHIAEAALSVFATKGYHRATIRDVARAAGVADGTIYASFADKEDLLVALLDPLDDLTRATAPSDPVRELEVGRETLRVALYERVEAFTPERLDALRVILSEALVDPRLRALVLSRILEPVCDAALPAFETLTASGTLKIPRAVLASRVLTAGVLGLVLLRLLDEPQIAEQWAEAPKALADMLLDGLIQDTEK